MQLNEIIGKRVISLLDAKELGIIIGAYVHKSTYEATHVCLNTNVTVSIKKIFAIDDVVTITDEPQAVNEDEYLKILAQQEVVTVSGTRLGKVKDLNLVGKKSKKELVCDKGTVKFKAIVAVSDNVITVNPTYRVLVKKLQEPKNEIFALNGTTEVEAYEEQTNAPKYDFLIGKKVKSEVSDISRSFVLMAGTLITERVIQNARRAGKLSELVNKSY